MIFIKIIYWYYIIKTITCPNELQIFYKTLSGVSFSVTYTSAHGKTHEVVKCSAVYSNQLASSPAVLLLFYWSVNSINRAIMNLESLESCVISFRVSVFTRVKLDHIVSSIIMYFLHI